MTPVYRSSVIVQVVVHAGVDQSDINALLASNQLVQTEAQLATSDPILLEVTKHHPALTMAQLRMMVSSETRINTQLFVLNVQSTNAKEAADLANEIAGVFIQQQEQSHQKENQKQEQELQQKISGISHQIEKIKLQLMHGVQATEKDNLENQLIMLQQHNSQWQSALSQLDVTQTQSSDFLLIVQAAQPATEPIQPDIWLNTGGGLGVGCLLGCLLIIIVDYLDQRVRNINDIQRLVDWPLLAMIWDIAEQKHHPQSSDVNGEAYRSLRTSVTFVANTSQLRTFLVTSAFQDEGKSTIAANLAIYMAMAGKNTLLIDADLRSPVLHEKFGLEADKPGFSNALLACTMFANRASLPHAHPINLVPPIISLNPFIHTVNIPNLRVMPSGPLPPNPSELLASKAMQRFLQLLDHYGAEIIVFDSTPLLGLSEATTLAHKIDGTIVVIDTKQIHQAQLRQAHTILTQANAHVIGCVLNKQKIGRSAAHSSYYTTYHHSNEQTYTRDNEQSEEVSHIPLLNQSSTLDAQSEMQTPTIPLQ
ncbi:hypothetical protein KDI_39780 [Dictyobacter arantiisoli]|uniref:CobQ/CobB/MinD/ParA nucleotide binding domain-containing protein n=2 Tax=Dictyobacter arantiisoli TaxID=2014874 RepID=A0A5A5THG9_9CHLR|nr:hypothetical protein KDI_39780 [Dictyobacter arantiisoli]